MSNSIAKPTAVQRQVARLRRLDACAVSDALDRLKLSGVVPGIPRQSGTGPVAGVAVTVQLDTGPPPPGPPRHLGTAAVEASGPDHVIVVEPARITATGHRGANRLYVALTRAVSRLTVLHAEPLPAVLG